MHQTRTILTPHSPQALQLDASGSVDEDDVDIDFDFRWSCEDDAGGMCVSRTGETLELSAFMGATVLFLPAGSLPAGELRGAPHRRITVDTPAAKPSVLFLNFRHLRMGAFPPAT